MNTEKLDPSFVGERMKVNFDHPDVILAIKKIIRPPKIIGYFIASSNDADSLQDKVNDLICKGWQPLGGVCFQRDEISPESCNWYFQQAMVSYEN
jgi:hypothetical protein